MIEKLQIFVSWIAPRWLVYWCVVRAIAHATTGPWSREVVTDVRAITVSARWMDKKKENRACWHCKDGVALEDQILCETCLEESTELLKEVHPFFATFREY